MPQTRMEYFRLLSDHLAWIEHQFLCGRSKEVNTPELIGQRVRVRVTMLREIRKRLQGNRQALLKSGQWHFHQDNAPVHNSILVSQRRLLWRGQEFHVCIINKSAHTKKVWKLIVCTSYICIYIYIYIYIYILWERYV